MAFTQNTFATVGAQAAPSPTVYSYSTDDAITTVTAANYFAAKVNELDNGDVIMAEIGSQLVTLRYDSGTATATTSTPANVVVVNKASDFPAAVAGVIELVPNPGDEIVYEIGALDIDVGSDRFTVTSGEVVIRGVHRSASRITSSTTGTMFTSSGSAFFQEFIAFDCPNAKWVDFSNSGFLSFANQNAIIVNCDTLGTISGAFVTSLRAFTVIATQTGGFTWTGTGNNQINMSSVLALSWAGTLFDLGTATFNIINIEANNRFISPSGTTILSGLTSSGNLTATGRGLVSGNIFNGIGTALSGIDTQDLKWQFTGNIFADGTTLNSRQAVDTFLTSTTTVTISDQGVYVAVGGANWSSDIADRFTTTTAGLITYIGLNNIEAKIEGFSTVEKVGGGADMICTKLAINGTVQDKTIGCTENSAATGVASVGLFTLSTGDTVQLFTANVDSTSNIIVGESTLIIAGG